MKINIIEQEIINSNAETIIKFMKDRQLSIHNTLLGTSTKNKSKINLLSSWYQTIQDNSIENKTQISHFCQKG